MTPRSAEKKRASRRRITAAAGALLRERGIRGTSVQGVMAKAGMTVGGFYAHFESKIDLVRRVLLETLRERRRMIRLHIGRRRGPAFVSAFLDLYLSRRHRDQPELGCPIAALLSDFERETPYLRDDLAREFEDMVNGLARHLDTPGHQDTAPDAGGHTARDAGEHTPRDAEAHAGDRIRVSGRDRALGLLAMSFGALQMARSIRGTALSDEVIAACRRVGASLGRAPEPGTAQESGSAPEAPGNRHVRGGSGDSNERGE
jgi:TetR/AcrR family transcriptional repressor of nem operon